MSWLFTWSGQSTGALASVLPMNIQGWFPLRLTSFISLLFKGLSRVLSSTRIQKHQFFSTPALTVQITHPYMTNRKTIALIRWAFVSKVMSLLFNMLSRLVIAFLPRSKRLLISWLQSPYAVILEPKGEKKSVTVYSFPPSICRDMMGLDATILVFWMLNFKPAFYSPLSLSSTASSLYRTLYSDIV